MFKLANLLNRKTVKNFLPEKIPSEILEQAIRVAWRTPTSLNSRPVILLDISSKKNETWIASQPAAQTAPHLFLFAWNAEDGEANARKFLAERYDGETSDDRVATTLARIIKNRDEWARQQIYLTAGYFAATLEASGVAGCFIAGFEKGAAAENVKLPEGYLPELIFACGFANPDDPKTNKTEWARSLAEFYFPES
ncbi:nitroreductase family protein [Patescibacteria group bacterium]|nr:nitroreductase family protein [Patescibacteria group bacterium]